MRVKALASVLAVSNFLCEECKIIHFCSETRLCILTLLAYFVVNIRLFLFNSLLSTLLAGGLYFLRAGHCTPVALP